MLRRVVWNWTLWAMLVRHVGAVPIHAGVCDVLRRPEQYSGKNMWLRGVYLQLPHGAILLPYPKCESAVGAVTLIVKGETVKVWREGGGRIGSWMLSEMYGRLDRDSGGAYYFAVESLTVVRRVAPYKDWAQNPVTK